MRYLNMVRGTITIYPHRLKSGLSLSIRETFRKYQIPYEDWRAQWPKYCDNNKVDDNSSQLNNGNSSAQRERKKESLRRLDGGEKKESWRGPDGVGNKEKIKKYLRRADGIERNK